MTDQSSCYAAPAYSSNDATSNEELDAMLRKAFEALDESYPSGVLTDLSSTLPIKSETLEANDDMFANLLPTTITEASEQSQTDEQNNPTAQPTKPKTRKRSASSKTQTKTCKAPKLDDGSLVVNQKPHESERQAIRRVKNNFASKVFRSKRRSKLELMLTQEEELTQENSAIRRDLSMVTEVVAMLKEGLVKRCHAKQLA